MYWKKWSKFSSIEYKKKKSAYSMINYSFHQNTLSEFIKEYNKMDQFCSQDVYPIKAIFGFHFK
jgi:hypothetical protein